MRSQSRTRPHASLPILITALLVLSSGALAGTVPPAPATADGLCQELHDAGVLRVDAFVVAEGETRVLDGDTIIIADHVAIHGALVGVAAASPDEAGASICIQAASLQVSGVVCAGDGYDQAPVIGGADSGSYTGAPGSTGGSLVLDVPAAGIAVSSGAVLCSGAGGDGASVTAFHASFELPGTCASAPGAGLDVTGGAGGDSGDLIAENAVLAVLAAAGASLRLGDGGAGGSVQLLYGNYAGGNATGGAGGASGGVDYPAGPFLAGSTGGAGGDAVSVPCPEAGIVEVEASGEGECMSASDCLRFLTRSMGALPSTPKNEFLADLITECMSTYEEDYPCSTTIYRALAHVGECVKTNDCIPLDNSNFEKVKDCLEQTNGEYVCGQPGPVKEPCEVAPNAPAVCGPAPTTNPCDHAPQAPFVCGPAPGHCDVPGVNAVPIVCGPSPEPCGLPGASLIPVVCGGTPKTDPCYYAPSTPGCAGSLPPLCGLPVVNAVPVVCGGIPTTDPCGYAPTTPGLCAPIPNPCNVSILGSVPVVCQPAPNPCPGGADLSQACGTYFCGGQEIVEQDTEVEGDLVVCGKDVPVSTIADAVDDGVNCGRGAVWAVAGASAPEPDEDPMGCGQTTKDLVNALSVTESVLGCATGAAGALSDAIAPTEDPLGCGQAVGGTRDFIAGLCPTPIDNGEQLLVCQTPVQDACITVVNLCISDVRECTKAGVNPAACIVGIVVVECYKPLFNNFQDRPVSICGAIDEMTTSEEPIQGTKGKSFEARGNDGPDGNEGVKGNDAGYSQVEVSEPSGTVTAGTNGFDASVSFGIDFCDSTHATAGESPTIPPAGGAIASAGGGVGGDGTLKGGPGGNAFAQGGTGGNAGDGGTGGDGIIYNCFGFVGAEDGAAGGIGGWGAGGGIGYAVGGRGGHASGVLGVGGDGGDATGEGSRGGRGGNGGNGGQIVTHGSCRANPITETQCAMGSSEEGQAGCGGRGGPAEVTKLTAGQPGSGGMGSGVPGKPENGKANVVGTPGSPGQPGSEGRPATNCGESLLLGVLESV